MEPKELQFFGRVTAGVTHEMKNVLAIIKETAGLLEDLMAMNREMEFPHRDRFARGLTSVRDQVRRGVELSDRLNRFAHSPDRSSAQVDLQQALEDAVFLARRFARLKQIELKIESSGNRPQMFVSPFRLQSALFAAMECCWKRLPPGSEIELGVAGDDDKALVFVHKTGDQDERDDLTCEMTGAADWEELACVAGEIGAKVEPAPACFGIDLALAKS
jgi:C4-dicarboxylate-specific signal transduction histidine kinase